MFTGIVEALGKITDLQEEGSNIHFTIQSSISEQLRIDQSVCHNGVCLTVIKVEGDMHTVTAVHETLSKTNLGSLKINDPINLERCLRLDSLIDGHIVQGHIDTTAQLLSSSDMSGSIVQQYVVDKQFKNLIVETGSICLNGISLTVFNLNDHLAESGCVFSVTIIPYTFQNTNMKNLQIGQNVNVEFDILGKYINRRIS